MHREQLRRARMNEANVGLLAMADLRERFETAADESKALPERPDNDTLLMLYGLYKQATQGDVEGSRPSAMDFVAAAKFDAWEELEGVAEELAMRRYIDLVESLK